MLNYYIAGLYVNCQICSFIDLFDLKYVHELYHFDLFFLIVCFTSYFMFSIAVLPHRPGVVYYHLLLR